MNAPPLALDEERRLAALDAYQILDTAAEQAFDDLTMLAAHICGAPISLLSFVDANRQWFKSRIGFAAAETPREISLCAHTILRREIYIIEDALRDERFTDNPLVQRDPRIRFYAGVPLITPDGYALGSLSVADFAPRELTPGQVEALSALSRHAMTHLELRREIIESRRSIAARLETEAALQKERDFTAAIVETAGALVIVLDRDGRVVRFNDTCERVAQRTFEEVRGQVFWDLTLLLPKEVESVRGIFTNVGAGHFPSEHENFWLAEDGARHLIRWSYTAILSGSGEVEFVIGIGTDVTEWRQAEHELRASEERYKYLVEHANDLIYRTDADGRFTFVNPTTLRLLNLSKDQIIGRRFYDLITPEARSEAEFFYGIQFFERKPNTYYEFPVQTEGGGVLWLGQNVQLVTDDERIIGFQSVARDITARKAAENQWQQLSLTDDLTGLYNRRGFYTFAEDHIKLARRTGKDLILIYLDMDDLKTINDRSGHDEGSRAIQQVAQILRSSFRDSDTVVRIGGDEFLVLGVTTPEATNDQVTARLHCNLAAHNAEQNHDYELSLSIGVARRSANCLNSIEELVADADRAMYADKQDRRKARPQ